jgi:hypothetical protein
VALPTWLKLMLASVCATLIAFVALGLASYAGAIAVPARWLMLGLGATAFVGTGAALMTLVFFSARAGYDEAADKIARRLQD